MCLQVGEKRQDNSGIMQGQLIKRTHIPKPIFDSDGWGTVNPADAPNGTSSLLKTADPPSVQHTHTYDCLRVRVCARAFVRDCPSAY